VDGHPLGNRAYSSYPEQASFAFPGQDRSLAGYSAGASIGKETSEVAKNKSISNLVFGTAKDKEERHFYRICKETAQRADLDRSRFWIRLITYEVELRSD
jgi:hypothetical protein